MGILSKYYEKNELDNILKEVNVTDVDNPKFMNIVMKMICSFGKKRRLTDYGVSKATELFNSLKPLNREDTFLTVFVMTELSILTPNDVNDLKLSKLFKWMEDKYSPEDGYLKEYAQKYLLSIGVVEVNPNYIPDVEKHFNIFLNEYYDEF
jgi:hypothetical protein|tara:strand:- start:532 stop:984 length:453 start_codon:yes stop_codon:yes gene_type:complete